MAIAFDAATDLGFTLSGTSISANHTCTGSDRLLVVGTVGNGGTDSITGVTYNGVAMTKSTNIQGGGGSRYATLWYLVAPATGSNSVVISGASGVIAGVAASYTGVNQSSPVDNTGTQSATTGNNQVSITPVANNCWMVAWTFSASGGTTVSAGAGSTLRARNTSFFGGCGILDNNAAITPPASTTLNGTQSDPTTNIATAAFTIAPPSTASTTSNFFMFMERR